MNAFGIAGTMASGSMAFLSDGAWTKRINAGWAAHSGVVAASLAKAGFTGPQEGIQGRFGLLTSHSDHPRPDRLTAGLGDSYEIMRVAFKPYGCCRYNHGLIQLALRMKTAHDVDIEDIVQIQLGVLEAGFGLVADPIDQKRSPKSVVDAQFSAPFAVALALVRGRATDGRRRYRMSMHDRSLMSRTVCYTDPALIGSIPKCTAR